ncbi:very short patch repair endonuclease [Stenotrophomonas sp.]|uniref:very short patch repair endonuclease n=1 Tax=Stenotrophomonas sp. TaxID=69392 RepID=UPI00289F76C2|nr:very short patch repair endonuclease [Stenotrophomonas sp.]
MVDVMSSAVRSALMSRIRAKNTKPEIIVRRQLWARGFRFRLHSKGLAGKPDLVLPKWKAAVFVHGCFWHRHEGCPLFRLPKTRSDFWDAKLAANRQRDLAAVRTLLSMGWRVAVVWECAIRLDSTGASDELAGWIATDRQGIEILASNDAVIRKDLDSDPL